MIKAIAIEPVNCAVHAMIVFTHKTKIALMTPIWPTTTALGCGDLLFAAVNSVGDRKEDPKPPIAKPSTAQI